MSEPKVLEAWEMALCALTNAKNTRDSGLPIAVCIKQLEWVVALLEGKDIDTGG